MEARQSRDSSVHRQTATIHPATLRNRLAKDIANLHARSGATWGRRVAPGYE